MRRDSNIRTHLEIRGVDVTLRYIAPVGSPSEHTGGGRWYWETPDDTVGPFYSRAAALRDAQEALS